MFTIAQQIGRNVETKVGLVHSQTSNNLTLHSAFHISAPKDLVFIWHPLRHMRLQSYNLPHDY